MKSEKIKEKMENLEHMGNKIVDYIISAYLVVMFSLYLIIFDNKYFNITVTRYNTFLISSVIFLIFALIAYVMRAMLKKEEIPVAINTEVEYKKLNYFEYVLELCILFKIAYVFGTYGDLILERFGQRTITIAIITCAVIATLIYIVCRNVKYLSIAVIIALFVAHLIILYVFDEKKYYDFYDQSLKNTIIIIALVGIKLSRFDADIKINKKIIAYPEFWLCIFLMANVFSALIAQNTKHALLGDMGRRMGLLTMTILILLVIVMGKRYKANVWIYMVLAATTIWVHAVALLQLSGNDFMHLRDNLSKKTANVFISTFGNINIYASYIAVSMPVFICIYIYAKKILLRMISAFVIAASGMAMMMSNSDSAYLGVGCAMVLIFFLAYKDDKLTAYFETIFLMLAGNFVLVMLNKKGITTYKKRGGFADLFDNAKLTIALLIVSCLVVLAAYVIYKRYGEKISRLDKKKHIKIMLIIMAAGAIAFCIIGVIFNLGLFRFNDKWGNYRGFIWRISGEIYSDFPISNKIFGYGNESVLSLTMANFRDEMIAVTHSRYDNCHNEILHFLLTTGALGALAYVGMFVSTIVYILKNSKKDYLAYIPAAAIMGYFAQAMVSIGQPITSPLFYIFMGIGIGYVRYLKKQEGEAV